MRRVDKRYMVAVPLLLEVGKRTVELVTEDISHGGLFLRTELEATLRQLVRVEMLLPPHADRFEAAGKIVHRVPAVQGDRAAGVGIQFYGLGNDPRARWATFVAFVRERFPESSERSVTLATANAVTPLYRRTHSEVFALQVHVATLSDLVTLFRRDVRQRRMFVLFDKQCYVGDEVCLLVVHPHTQDVFELRGRVSRCVRDGGIGGIEIALDLDQERTMRFEEFVYDAIAPFFDDEEVHRG